LPPPRDRGFTCYRGSLHYPHGQYSYVKEHGLLTSAAYRIRHFESRCKDTAYSEFLLVKYYQ